MHKYRIDIEVHQHTFSSTIGRQNRAAMVTLPLRTQLQQAYLLFCTSTFQEYPLCRVEILALPPTIPLSLQFSLPLSHLFCHHPVLLLSWQLILLQPLYFPILIKSFLPSSKEHLPRMSFLISTLYLFLKDWVFYSSLIK